MINRRTNRLTNGRTDKWIEGPIYVQMDAKDDFLGDFYLLLFVFLVRSNILVLHL